MQWMRAADSAEQAFAAHRLLERGVIHGAGMILTDEHLGDLLLHRDETLAATLRERALAPLAGETARSRDRLMQTLLAWLDHQGAVPAVAGALHVHPQTVRYRLGRLRELFGERLEDPRGRFELALALRSLGNRD
jgi:DNA-binding PucR family transcriptional regulator